MGPRGRAQQQQQQQQQQQAQLQKLCMDKTQPSHTRHVAESTRLALQRVLQRRQNRKSVCLWLISPVS